MGDETPSPTPWATTPYTPTGAVEHFHGCLRMRLAGSFSGTNAFPVDGAGDREYREYLSGVVATAFIPLGVVLVFMIPFYWMFLCYRCGCCYDTFYRRFPACLCCSSERGEGCLRTGHPKNHPLLARVTLLVLFCVIIGLNAGIDNARLELSDSALKVTEILDEVSDMMASLNDYAIEMNATAGKISTYASNLGCTDDYSDETSSIGEASDTIAEYAVLISEQIGDLPHDMAQMSDTISENRDEYVNWAGLALAALALLYAVFGLIGAMCIEGKVPLARCATGFLALTNAFGVLVLIIIAVLLAAELTAGIVLGDFCAADGGPSNALVSVMQSQTDDDSEAIEIMQFYATCQGTNPMSTYLDTQQEAVTNMTDILDTYKDLFIHSSMCCDSSYDTNDIDPDTVGDSCTFYSSSNPDACTPNTACDYDGGSANGGCVAAGGCTNSSYTSVVNEIEYLALDDDGPLVGFFSEFECAKVNPRLAKLVNEVMCDSLTESLWWMVAVHISVLVLIYLVMLVSSFARQVIYEANAKSKDDDVTEEIKGIYPKATKNSTNADGTPSKSTRLVNQFYVDAY